MKTFSVGLVRLIMAVFCLSLSLAALQTLLELPFGFSLQLVVFPVAIGFLAGMVLFLLGLRGSYLYVLGHELTHWVTAKVFFRKTGRFSIRSMRGSVAIERPNIWIVLAPYCFPIYTFLWLGFYGVFRFFHGPADTWLICLASGIAGLSYAFHVLMTFQVMHREQPDLKQYGWTLSLSVILMGNLFLCLLVLTAGNGCWLQSLRAFVRIYLHDLKWVWQLASAGGHLLTSAARSRP
jgi:hypothetical protein